jgi:hypothetical protein
MIEYIDLHTERPQTQIRFDSKERLPLNQFPVPEYHLVNINDYFLANIQYSSGVAVRMALLHLIGNLCGDR